ncbi:MAG: DUF4038 domain-containing protein [Chloroflexi bacterium]|nr:DUF4038 domain-containing protein [Chloroflexota bacterium]
MKQIERVHVWQKVELTFQAEGRYRNPYTEVEVWVDLEGPGFSRRVYGFWDGGPLFRVRLVAPTSGRWHWVSGSNQCDKGLNDHHGEFLALEWSEAEKTVNPCRRGFLRPTSNGHALEYADGTPCFLLGDTWWAAPTFRFPWYEDEVERPLGPGAGFKDMVRYRKAQGYNCIALLVGHPAWANDGYPPTILLDDGTALRSAWRQEGTNSAKNMHNEGGRPFFFPGKVPGYQDVYPDVDRLNPAYFAVLDKKMDYLNAQGFIPFLEVARRDVTQAWKRFYDWPDSYARYIAYVWARYQAHNVILSPIHFDSDRHSLPSREFDEPANAVVEKGIPAFEQLRSANAAGSTYNNFAGHWLTLHQIGNRRDHNSHWLLEEIYHYVNPPKPALNGEPYYPGFPPDTAVAPDSPEASLYARSGMYGSFLSGGFAGHIYGAVGLWGGDVEEAAPYKTWEALRFESGAQMAHLRTFVFCEGRRYQELIPDADWVYPNKTGGPEGNRGWAYCARTPEKDLYLLYFEADCPRGTVRSALLNRRYAATWFDPRTGAWLDAGVLEADNVGRIALPAPPTTEDWALRLKLV